MRRNDRNAGSIRALIAANIVVARPRHQPASPEPESANRHFVGRMHGAAQFDEAVQP